MQISSLYALRPLHSGQIIDRAVRLYRNAFWPCLLIALVIEIPLLLSRFFWRPPAFDSFEGPGTTEWLGFGLLRLGCVWIIRLVTLAAFSQVVIMVYEGRKVRIAAAYWAVLSRWWEILLTSLTLIPTTILMIAWYFIPCIGSLSGLGLNIFYFTVLVPLCVPIVMLERKKGPAVLRRAWDLTRNHFWSAIGFVLFVLLFYMLIWIGPRLSLQILSVSLFHLDELILHEWAIPGLGGFLSLTDVIDTLFSSLVWPVLMLACTLWYLDLRVRYEGFDLLLSADAQLPDTFRSGPEKMIALTPDSLDGGILHSGELARFIGLTIITVGVPVALLYGLFIIAELLA